MHYYLYRHVRLDTNEPFYVGFGTKQPESRLRGFKTEYSRAYEKSKRSDFWKSIVNKTEYRVDILVESDDKLLIQELEKYFIDLYGRRCADKGTLVNFSKGGETYYDGPRTSRVSITQLTLDNVIVKIWDGSAAIENETGYLKTNIVKCCRKKQLTAYGFKWIYTNDRSYDKTYPSAARAKTCNNRNGIVLKHKVSKEIIIFRTLKETASFLGCHYATVQRYLQKGYCKEYYVQYRDWAENIPLIP